MTKEEFLLKQRKAKREESLVSAIWLVVFFGALFGNLPLVRWLQLHRSKEWMNFVYGPLFFGFLIGNLFLLAWVTKRRNRRFGLLCPSCKKPLTLVAGQIAVATGHCGHCGAAVFSD